MRTITEGNGYRVVEMEDKKTGLETLKGDKFTKERNPDLEPERLAKRESIFENEVQEYGVYGYLLEKWNPDVGAGWEHVESHWGLIGKFDSDDSSRYCHPVVSEMVNAVLVEIKKTEELKKQNEVSAAKKKSKIIFPTKEEAADRYLKEKYEREKKDIFGPWGTG